MLKNVRGVILRAINYSETSIICDVYTDTFGLRTYIINGVRKKNSKVSPGLMRVMSLVEMIVYHNENKDINRIKEIKASHIYQNIPFNVSRGSIGLFITEVAQKTIKETEANAGLFTFLTDMYILLDTTDSKIINFPVWFLVQFSLHLGLYPDVENLKENSTFDYSTGRIVKEDPGHHYFFSCANTHLLAGLLSLDFKTSSKIPLSTEDRRLFLNDMLLYYRYHIENFGELNSIVVLQAVFS